MHTLTLVLLAGILSIHANSNDKMTTLGNFTKLEQTPKAVIAHYDSGEARIELFKSGVVHLSVVRGSNELKSFAVIDSVADFPAASVSVSEDLVELKLPSGTFEFLPASLKMSYKSESGPESVGLTNLQFSDTGIVARLDIDGARNFYGLGEKTLPFNKYGSRCTMWNTDYPAYPVKFDPLYESIPFLLKSDPRGAYGLFFDNTSRATFDIGTTDSDRIIYTARKGSFELYILPGKNPAEVVSRFADLTGKMHMPPVWALGYQQSRWSYYPESRVLQLARDFRENKIPCDVIYLDINYMDGYRCFTWSPKDFPTPNEMLDTLHRLGFKVVTIIDPGIKDDPGYRVYDTGFKEDIFVKKPDGDFFTGTVWPGNCVFPDFFSKKAREWWGSQYKYLLDSGVDGFWNDMNEPSVFNSPNKTFDPDVIHRIDEGENVEGVAQSVTETHAAVHNAYGMQMVRGTREGLLKLEPNKRPLVLTRANYAGGQRYAAMWTGDNFASFAHLRLALTMFLNIGLSGQPFMGSDVGGFIGNPSGELFTRWLELGLFSPFYRTHSVIDSKPREPWAFGEPYTSLNREIINRRYELLPQIYTAFRNAHRTGLPILRPLFLIYPNDPATYNIADEFIFGNDLLVAPVLDSGAVKRSVYFPAGKWLSFDGTESYAAGKHEVDAPLGTTPVFVKDGSVIFTQSLIQSTTEQADTLFLRLYGDKSGSGNAYFDDGTSMEFKNGNYLDLSVSFSPDEKDEVLKFTMKGDYVPGYTYIAIEMPFTGKLPYHEGVLETAGQTFAPVLDMQNGLLRATFPFSTKITKITLR